ncbi:MAG TPA: hypothetical protein V6C97_06525 [Oculatellaceae cyanobacterium]
MTYITTPVPTVMADAGRYSSNGCWTGWVADMQLVKSLRHKTSPETYMAHFPRHRATSLNTWLARFGIFSNGMFFELDRHGSALVKELICRSATSRGYWIRVDGVRQGDKIKVTAVREIAKEPMHTDPELERIAQSQLRSEFAKMGI